MITAVNSISFKNNYNNIHFGEKKKQKNTHETPNISSVLKAIPLATMIAMSPLTSTPVTAQTTTPNKEKTIMFQDFEDETKHLRLFFTDTDGDENTAERISLQTTETHRRNVSDPITREKVPVKYVIANVVHIDSLKQVDVTNVYPDGNKVKSKEFYVIGDTHFMTSAMKATDGSNKTIRSAKDSYQKNFSYEVPKEVYQYLINVTSGEIPNKTVQTTNYVSFEELFSF